MTPTPFTEAQRSPAEASRLSRLERAFLGRPRLHSNKTGNAAGLERFRLEAIERLSIAIINRAVLDVLEKGRYSLAAERWLLSGEFDRIHNLLG
jgi:hypothetical protein